MSRLSRPLSPGAAAITLPIAASPLPCAAMRAAVANSLTSSSLQPRPVGYGGHRLGTAVVHELGVRFIAGDVRVADMDQSIWPTAEYAERSAQQLFRASRGKI